MQFSVGHCSRESVDRGAFEVERARSDEQVASCTAGREVRLDDVRERFAGTLAPGEGLVGGQIDGNRFDGHALIMHLDRSMAKKPATALRTAQRSTQRRSSSRARLPDS